MNTVAERDDAWAAKRNGKPIFLGVCGPVLLCGKPSPDSIAPVRPQAGASDGPTPLRIAGDETPALGGFGYYSQFADDDEPKAVNE